LQGLPEKAPCNILPEQEFGATTITESAAASQNKQGIVLLQILSIFRATKFHFRK
jgi:acyl CoA:acetate/3-ketoacid CoA transferase